MVQYYRLKNDFDIDLALIRVLLEAIYPQNAAIISTYTTISGILKLHAIVLQIER